MFYCHVKHRTGEKETREMKGKWLIKAIFFLKFLYGLLQRV